MLVIHYLDVKDGDCSIIQHESGNVSVIDACNARKIETFSEQNRAIYEVLQKSSIEFQSKGSSCESN